MPQYATVMLTIPHENGFTYEIPPEFQEQVRIGIQVVVPFGKRYLSGIVMETSERIPQVIGDVQIKPIKDIITSTPLVTPELKELLKWISEYYVCQLGESYRLIQSSINVSKSQLKIQRLISIIPENLDKKYQVLLEKIPLEKELSLKEFRDIVKSKNIQFKLIELEREGFIQRKYSEIKKKESIQKVEYFRYILPEVSGESNMKTVKGNKTKQIQAYLEKKDWISYQELKSAGFSRQILNRMVDKGILEKKIVEKDRLLSTPFNEVISDVELTPEQAEMVNQVTAPLQAGIFETFLLHGITGSGKTQIYIELIRKALQLGRQAIVLIPEIVLTPQTLARFQYHFPDQIAVIHSRLYPSEKREVLYKIRQGKFNIVLGPRSAIFAPVSQLGLVIVDEEHEGSYKQSDARPHYHGRDVAIYRAKLNNAVVVLGSATPSFESLYNAREGVYKYFRLGKRIQSRNLPRIQIVDLKEEWKKSGVDPVLSEQLELKIESRLLTKEQVMLLQNRRGYSPYILCKECGFIAKCKNCDITLTYHIIKRQLICHYCGHKEKAPDACPSCNGLDVIYKGIGTQRIEEILKEKFTEANVLRMDQDTVKGKHGHAVILEKFRSGAADILLGTKMIAKGLDFGKVTLVGVVSADQGMHFPDFRASEKVFQLLTQAAGRAGRGHSSGEVVVQTYDPEHFMFKQLMTHDYTVFYEKEIQSRKYLKYPPFSRLILIRIEGQNLEEVQGYSEVLVRFLWKTNKNRYFTVLGPAPSPLFRIQNVYRYQILLKQERSYDTQIPYIRQLLKQGILNNPDVKKWPVKVTIDVDPIDIL